MTDTVATIHSNRTSLLSRREFIRLAGAAAASAALASCVPHTPPVPSRPVQLVYRDWRTDWFPTMAQRMIAEFNATHPRIRVFYTLDPENAEFDAKTLAAFETGIAPDVVQGCCSSLPKWAQKDYLLDLRPYVRADLDRATIEDWDPMQYKALFTRDGKQYGLPKYHGALALYYNKDLFDQAHVDYPDEGWDYDDYYAAMKRLTRGRTRDGTIDQWGTMMEVSWERIQVHVNAWGGHFVDPRDATVSRMDMPQSLTAMEWLAERMWGDRVMATALNVQKKTPSEAFIAGLVAMVEEGSWALKQILSSANFRVGLAPFPKGPARHAALATTDGFGIYAGTKYPEAAWELLKFLIGKDYGRAMAREHLLQPARASLVDEWAQYVREQHPAQAKDLNLKVFAEAQLQGYSVTTETFANQADAERITSAAWEEIYTLGQAPVSRMRDVSREVQAAQQGFA